MPIYKQRKEEGWNKGIHQDAEEDDEYQSSNIEQRRGGNGMELIDRLKEGRKE